MLTSDKVCCECLQLIVDPHYLMIVDHNWHVSCLKCGDCGILLEQEAICYFKDGQILCRYDYMKCRSQICMRCTRVIQKGELVLRAEQFIFHLNCFTCVACNIRLCPGDDYGLKNNHIYCADHLLSQESYKSYVMLDDSGYHTSPNERPRSTGFEEEDDESFLTLSQTLFPSSYYTEVDDSSSNSIHDTRQKRLRTSFKHHQLRFMKSYFMLNHNPDAKDLKYLSEKINLPKRVLQVWFQNARAKYRRSNASFKEVKTNSSSSEINDL